MKILALETSCDDTSVAIVKEGSIVLSSVVSSQTELHSEFGGVVPEVAAREHVKNMIPVLAEALKEAQTELSDIDYVAVTRGPGLIGSLIVGVNTARMLAELTKKPLVALHHTEGHIYANWLTENLEEGQKPPEFPLVCLTVSGGHSNIILMKNHLDYDVIGETQDDAAGEAFDKVAKMLDLGYPGGPVISKYAKEGSEHTFKFPRVDLTKNPVRNEEGYLVKPDESLDFSFSGLKTAVLKEVRGIEQLTEEDKSNIAASFQIAVNEILARNLLRAISRYKPKAVLLSGGVAANMKLRDMIKKQVEDLGLPFYYPKPKYCTDNAAMIAAAAYYHIQDKDFTDPKKLVPEPNYKLT
jgi:N6-L-threonylcarbamoyladenine synthase